VMGSLVHTGLGSSSLVAHVLPYPPPPTRKQLCTRSCSNKHTHTGDASLSLQDTVQRAGSVHLAERLCSFSPSTQRAFHGERAADKSDCGGLGEAGDECEVRSARTRHNTNCINQGNVKRAQGCCPWSPPQGGARDQSASARRGLPSKGEARALHHQSGLAPALTLTTPCLCSLLLTGFSTTRNYSMCVFITAGPSDDDAF
jgi:hypothetical protein